MQPVWLPLPQSPSVSRRTAASFEGLMDGGSTSELTQMVVSRIQLPTGCWNGGLGPCCDVGRSFLIHGPLSGVALDMASSFHQNSQAREDEQDGSHSLFVNNLESDIPSLCCIIYWQWVTSSAYTGRGREHHKDRRQDWVGLGGHVRCCLPQHSSQKILHNMYYNLEFVFLLGILWHLLKY